MERQTTIINMLQKENEALKRINSEKLSENETIITLMNLLELQRERINCLESGI